MPCCYVHVCFVQVTMCGSPDALTRLGAHTFLLLSSLLGSQNKYQQESARTEASQCIGSAKQVSKLSLGQKRHGQNITTPLKVHMYLPTRSHPVLIQIPEQYLSRIALGGTPSPDERGILTNSISNFTIYKSYIIQTGRFNRQGKSPTNTVFVKY